MNEEFDLERMLARSQFGLSILLLVGYFVLIALAGMKLIDVSIVKDITPFIGIVVYYWFQRQRPRTGNDIEVPSPKDPNEVRLNP